MRSFRKIFLLPLLTAICGLLLSCQGADRKRDRSQPGSGNLYLDYRVWGDEESGLVTIRLQFRDGGPEGDALAVDETAEVLLDGEILETQSSRMNGSYYEAGRAIDGFAGRHQVVLKGWRGKDYLQEFEYPVFTLARDLPAEIAREELVLELEGLTDGDNVKILMNDTAFYSRGIDRYDSVRDGRIVLTAADLSRLRPGPVHLELIREEERPTREHPGGGGLLQLAYGLSREAILR